MASPRTTTFGAAIRSPHNVVVDPETHAGVAGIIDFGDLTSTARVNDLAIAAAYQVADSDDPLAPACEMIAAYQGPPATGAKPMLNEVSPLTARSASDEHR